MAAVICSLIGVVSGKEMAVNMKLKAEIYDNGLRHEEIMALKNVCIRNQTLPARITNRPCTADMARAGPSRCLRLDPIHVLHHRPPRR